MQDWARHFEAESTAWHQLMLELAQSQQLGHKIVWLVIAGQAHSLRIVEALFRNAPCDALIATWYGALLAAQRFTTYDELRVCSGKPLRYCLRRQHGCQLGRDGFMSVELTFSQSSGRRGAEAKLNIVANTPQLGGLSCVVDAERVLLTQPSAGAGGASAPSSLAAVAARVREYIQH